MALGYSTKGKFKWTASFQNSSGTSISQYNETDETWDNQAVVTNNSALIKAGTRLPCSPYSAAFRRCRYDVGTLRVTTLTSSATYVSLFNMLTHGVGVGGTTAVPFTDGRYLNLVSRASAKARSKMRDQRIGLGEALAESDKTVGMLANAARDLARAGSQVRRFQFGAAARTLGLDRVPSDVSRRRSFDKNWLEYRYGWGPLVFTMSDLANLVVDGLRQGHLFRVSARVNEKYSRILTGLTLGPDTNLGDLGNTRPSFYRKINRHITDVLEVEVGFVFRVQSNLIADMQQLGLDPLKTSWELIPLSFVADWFANVGDYISQATDFAGTQYVDGWVTKTYRGETDCEIVVTNWNNSTGTTKAWDGVPGASKTEVYVERKNPTQPPPVSLHWNVNLNTNRLIDAAALLSTTFSRK